MKRFDTSFLDWTYLNGLKTPPATGLASAVLSTMPSTPGTYNFRLFASNGYQKLATSATVTVSAGSNDSFANRIALPGYILTSRLTFAATAGTSYQIAVDGFNGDSGPIVLAVGN